MDFGSSPPVVEADLGACHLGILVGMVRKVRRVLGVAAHEGLAVAVADNRQTSMI